AVEVGDIPSCISSRASCGEGRTAPVAFCEGHFEKERDGKSLRRVQLCGIGEATMLVAVVVVVSISWGEGDATETLSEAGLADDGELLVGSFCGIGVGDVIDDGYEAVGIGALITVA